MSDEDLTKELPGVPDTEPTMYTVMERLNAMQATMDRMQETMDRMQDTADRRQDIADQRQDIADRRHAEILELFKGVRNDIGAVRDEIAVLALDTIQVRGSQRELRRRIEDLESKAS